MNIDEMVPSKSNFLTKEDVGEEGKDLTIKGFHLEEIGFENNKEQKYVIEWTHPDYKPMVLNKENAKRLKMILKTSDTEHMVGKTVNVFNDPFVTFAGEMKGGLRIRPPAHAAAQAQMRQQQPQQRPQQRPQPQQPENQEWQPTPPPEAYEDIPY